MSGDFWGSAHDESQDVTATVDGRRVEVDVAVNGEDQIRIAAWAEGFGIEIVFDPAAATVLRDVLTHAIEEGRMLA